MPETTTPDGPGAVSPQPLSESAVEAALRYVIADLDYDLHKSVEDDEETGEDTYPDVVSAFVRIYMRALS